MHLNKEIIILFGGYLKKYFKNQTLRCLVKHVLINVLKRKYKSDRKF